MFLNKIKFQVWPQFYYMWNAQVKYVLLKLFSMRIMSHRYSGQRIVYHSFMIRNVCRPKRLAKNVGDRNKWGTTSDICLYFIQTPCVYIWFAIADNQGSHYDPFSPRDFSTFVSRNAIHNSAWFWSCMSGVLLPFALNPVSQFWLFFTKGNQCHR